MIAGINERWRSTNETNLTEARDMFMSADLFHWQNACIHCLVKLIRFIGFICC